MAFIIGTPHTKGSGNLQANTGGHRNRKIEGDVKTCTHCQTVIIMQAWKEDGGWCGRCQAPICGPCADRMLTHGCEPFIAQIEKGLNKAYKLEQMRKVAGLDSPPPGYIPSIIVGSSR